MDTTATGQGRDAASPAVRVSTRSGSTIGRRVCRRSRLRCGMRAAVGQFRQLGGGQRNGSPPLRMTSSTRRLRRSQVATASRHWPRRQFLGIREMPAEAVAAMHGAAAGGDQQRASLRICAGRRVPRAAARSPTASSVKPGDEAVFVVQGQDLTQQAGRAHRLGACVRRSRAARAAGTPARRPASRDLSRASPSRSSNSRRVGHGVAPELPASGDEAVAARNGGCGIMRRSADPSRPGRRNP
jgi:hypothetical protein